jgi:KDO2-lipid IV(A) lauroyltransferase
LNLRNHLEYLPFITFATLVRILPRPQAIRLGRALGGLGRFLQPRRVRIARDNLRQALPAMSGAERQEILKKTFVHLGVSLVDMLRLDKFSGQADLDRYFIFEGLEHLHEALGLGRGCILLSGHVGFWEAGAFFLPLLGMDAGFVAKPIRNPLVNAYFNRMRTAFGCYLISSRKGARRIIKALQSNHLVGILMDQHTRPREAVKVPFFGRPAYTTPIVAQIAMKLQTPVVPSFAYRTDDGRYRVRFEPMILLAPRDLSEAEVLRNTALLTGSIEQGVRREISQWFWVHRRWRVKATQRGAQDEEPGKTPSSKTTHGGTDAG